jgi:ubiquitin-protein ligase
MLTNLAIKRILSDIKYLHENSLEDCGIYYDINDEDISILKVLFIGPENTPYEGGFFLFNIKFPDNYPLYPPEVIFQSFSNNIRFNPNLYTNGKVCLSLLNTWLGPSWTPQNTISSILLSILSMVFTNEPLKNEPGFESSSRIKIDNYNKILEHETFNIAIIKTIENIPNDFLNFKIIIHNFLKKNYKKYILNIKKYKKNSNNKHYSINIYNMNIKCDYDLILRKFEKINIDNNIKKRKCPNNKANMYNEGYKMLSENNDKLYIIKKKKNNILYWSLHK